MHGRPIRCRILTMVTIAALTATAATPSLVADRAAVRSFLGGTGGVIAFVDKDGGNTILWADFSAQTPTLRTLSAMTDCRNPIISADGTRVVFTTEDNKVWAAHLGGGDPVKIGDIDGSGKNGGVAYWHRQDGADYIMYCSRTEKHGYATGSTYLQRIRNGIEPEGERTVIHDKAFDAGITTDGRWIGETYGSHHAYDRVNDKEYGTFYRADGSGEGQACNGSMLRDGTHRFLMLVLPHDYIRLFAFDPSADRWEEERTYTKPSGTREWQTPDISTSGDFFTATAQQSDDDYHLYLVKTGDGDALRVVSGDIGNSHLYVRASAAAEEPFIGVTPASLSFGAEEGGANPAGRTVTVENTGAGTLGAVSVSDDADWLTVTPGGDGNTQTLDNRVDIAGLGTGTYDATVRVSGGGAANEATYRVTLNVSVVPGDGTGILREVWSGIDGDKVSALTAHGRYPDSPDSRAVVDSLASPVDESDNYGSRFRGYVLPPVTGAYTFWVTGDDETRLLLSGSESAAEAARIASVNDWAAAGEWDKEPGQQSQPVTLTAGRRYYIEVLHKEGTGGDHVAVRWELPDGTMEDPIPGHRLDPFTIEPAVLLAPDGGEVWGVGQTVTIAWKTLDISAFDDCAIAVSTDNGRTFHELTTGGSIGIGDPDWGAFSWTIPAELPTAEGPVSMISDQCRIKVHQYGESSPVDVSAAPFTISSTSAGHRAARPTRGAGIEIRRAASGALAVRGHAPGTVHVYTLHGREVSRGNTGGSGRWMKLNAAPGISVVRWVDAASAGGCRRFVIGKR